ncbi:sirohydrochlorin chelatase [Halobacillus litoralis]|uniref:Sirohydrochlorin chelatase n=1 Tax=Halobacillus litoralis TaxID=45668 RepID=A0A410M8L5_9BACI|nr:sirohydrochlorin chelatase [Halobacillus litoralis]QAS51042.1 sirohydrochlorin chelatase [Halobacillus litoralis]
MKAVLYVSHGSRRKEATDEALHFLQNVHQQIGVPLHHICFLELAHPDFHEGIERLVRKGATKVAVLPVLLLSAGHYFKDIPEKIERAEARFPHIEFSYGEPLGVQERIVDVLVDRIQQTGAVIDTETNVLLVGRGSRHPDTKTSIERIARLLKEKTGAPSVEVCYLAALSPSFEEGLKESVNHNEKTIVVPYLWFTGVLIESIKQKINEFTADGYEIYQASYLDTHPNMVRAAADRVHEALGHIREQSDSGVSQ